MRISLFQSANGQVRIWKAEDIIKARKDYRIIGSFIGNLPTISCQKTLSLPLLLMPEEVTFLLIHRQRS
jgi:hypothetical protein